MKEKIIGIYKITNQVNGKCYIGQSQDIYTRFSKHNWSVNDTKDNKILIKAFNKYGIDNFSFDIIEECQIEELDDKEIYYIDKYRSYVGFKDCHGYNATIGGGGIRGYKMSKEAKQKIGKSNYLVRNPYPVLQYNMAGLFVEEFESILNAHKKTGVGKSGIRACISGTYKTAGGFIWIKKVGDIKKKINPNSHITIPAKHLMKKVAQYNLDGELIRVYCSATFAANENNFIQTEISSCCRDELNIGYGYIWRYFEDAPDSNIDTTPFLEKYFPNKVARYGKDGKFIDFYLTAVDASDSLKINESLIVQCVSENYPNKMAGGYYWKKYNGDNSNIIITNEMIPFSGERKVDQHDLNGNYIATFKTVKQAQEATGASRSKICMCCKGQRKSAGGFTWKYTDGMGIKDIYNPKPSKVRKVQQFSVNDDLIKTFESISEAHREVGVSASMIADCCKNKREIACGYKWKFVD